jgi:hypothetical protein
MPNKPGRNDPCPCGSGKKYKRCCLPTDEAAARERSRQQGLFDDDVPGDLELEEDDADEGFLEAAAPGEPDQSAEQRNGTTTVTVIRREDASRPVDAFDLSGVLKAHRRQGGTCALCGKELNRTSALKHVANCASSHDAANGTEQQLLHVRAIAPGLPAYWLDVEVKADAKLEALDSFLRRIWLECCGHLSMFRVGSVNYFSRGYEFGFTRGFGSLDRQSPVERSMSVRVRDALPSDGGRIGYEYDFGSTTSLDLRAIGERTGRLGRSSVRLLARNTAPIWPCAICGQPATMVCTYCLQEERNAFVCTKHRRKHACGEDEGFLPVVNSPRMGVCGYTGET